MASAHPDPQHGLWDKEIHHPPTQKAIKLLIATQKTANHLRHQKKAADDCAKELRQAAEAHIATLDWEDAHRLRIGPYIVTRQTNTKFTIEEPSHVQPPPAV
jgi:hypothetical protein